jgi:3-dehydroquinate dehydratase-2
VRILVLQGPNLNLLGRREPERYGTVTLDEIQRSMDAAASDLGVVLDHRQSNHEGVLVDIVQEGGFSGAVVNAGAYTHTSIALRDALLGMQLPFVEVHLSNVWQREPFRHASLLADIAIGAVVGFGPPGYVLGLRGLVGHLRAASGAARSPGV